MKAVRWSSLKEIAKSPAHYRWALEHPREQTPSMRIGDASDRLIFEPGRFDGDFATYDGRRAGKEWEAFQKAHEGKCILSVDEAEKAHAIADAVRAHPRAMELLSGGRAQQEVTWTFRAPFGDGFTLPCGGRVDYVGPLGLVDVKTSKAAGPQSFGREVANYSYHAQLAFYADGLTANGLRPPAVWLIAVENEPPHGVAVYSVPPEVLELGRERYYLLLDRLQRCLSTDTWPAWPDEQVLALPRWVTNADAED